MPKRGRRKNWEGEYFKLSKDVVEKLEFLSEYMGRTKTQIVEELINALWVTKMGNLDVKTAKILIKK
jgi:predicted DNA-binding protein